MKFTKCLMIIYVLSLVNLTFLKRRKSKTKNKVIDRVALTNNQILPGFQDWSQLTEADIVSRLWDARNPVFERGQSYNQLNPIIRNEISHGTSGDGLHDQLSRNDPVNVIPKVSLYSGVLPEPLFNLAVALLTYNVKATGKKNFVPYSITYEEEPRSYKQTIYGGVTFLDFFCGGTVRDMHANGNRYLPPLGLQDLACPNVVKTTLTNYNKQDVLSSLRLGKPLNGEVD